jgi:hypothetical protein
MYNIICTIQQRILKYRHKDFKLCMRRGYNYEIIINDLFKWIEFDKNLNFKQVEQEWDFDNPCKYGCGRVWLKTTSIGARRLCRINGEAYRLMPKSEPMINTLQSLAYNQSLYICIYIYVCIYVCKRCAYKNKYINICT